MAVGTVTAAAAVVLLVVIYRVIVVVAVVVGIIVADCAQDVDVNGTFYHSVKCVHSLCFFFPDNGETFIV